MAWNKLLPHSAARTSDRDSNNDRDRDRACLSAATSGVATVFTLSTPDRWFFLLLFYFFFCYINFEAICTAAAAVNFLYPASNKKIGHQKGVIK